MTVIQGFTSTDLEALPDLPGVRYEIIDGELLVSRAPSFRHQYAVTVLVSAVYQWDAFSDLGFVVSAPGLVFTEDNDVIPDLVWVSRARLDEIEDDKGHLSAAPELVVEVLSPGRVNEIRDRELKLRLYGRQGVREYWIVDCDQQTVEVFRRGGDNLQHAATLRDGDQLTSPLLAGFTCSVSSLWQTGRGR